MPTFVEECLAGYLHRQYWNSLPMIIRSDDTTQTD